VIGDLGRAKVLAAPIRMHEDEERREQGPLFADVFKHRRDSAE
jgi:hypothetical protein